MDGIRDWVEKTGTGHYFYYAFPFCIILLLVLMKRRGTRVVIPAILITLVIVNPLFYQIWERLDLYAYWRLLWMVPVIPLLSAIIPSLTERTGKRWLKAVLLTAGIGMICVGGSFVYAGDGGSFIKAPNIEKLPEEAVLVSDRILELDGEQPRVIAQYPLCVYMRQYTGEIDTLYGRDIEGYIWKPREIAVNIHNIVSSQDGDMTVVAAFMAENDYKYLILHGEERREALSDAGFKLIETVAGYDIYTVGGVSKGGL